MIFLEHAERLWAAGLCAGCGKPAGSAGGMFELKSDDHDTYQYRFCERCYPTISYNVGRVLGELWRHNRASDELDPLAIPPWAKR